MEAADSPAYWDRYDEAEERASFRERRGADEARVESAAAAALAALAASMSLLLDVVETISMSSSIEARRAVLELFTDEEDEADAGG